MPADSRKKGGRKANRGSGSTAAGVEGKRASTEMALANTTEPLKIRDIGKEQKVVKKIVRKKARKTDGGRARKSGAGKTRSAVAQSARKATGQGARSRARERTGPESTGKTTGKGRKKVLTVELQAPMPKGLSIKAVKNDIRSLRGELLELGKTYSSGAVVGDQVLTETGFGEKAQALKLKQLRLYARIERHKEKCSSVETRILLSKLEFEVRKDMMKLDELINRRYFSLLFHLKREVQM